MNQVFTDQELDSLIDSVDATYKQAEQLAKNAAGKQEPANGGKISAGPARKAEPDPDDQNQGPQGAPQAGQADDAPAAGAAPADADAAGPAGGDMPPGAADPAQAGAAPADPAAAGAADPAAAGAPGEQQLEGEGGAPGGEEAPLSDEELQQIYTSMAPEELERHYMIIRPLLQAAYQKAEVTAKSEGAGSQEGTSMNKAEKEQFDKLQKDNEEMKKSVDLMGKVVDLMTKPQRKAITGTVDFIKKGEDQTAPGAPAVKELSKSEVGERFKSLGGAPAFSKSEREAINAFLLHGDGKERVSTILNSKGSNK
ncbi:MAG: hypothetical protein ACREGB_01690 [Candidatus Saccharimonadales bacterium]